MPKWVEKTCPDPRGLCPRKISYIQSDTFTLSSVCVCEIPSFLLSLRHCQNERPPKNLPIHLFTAPHARYIPTSPYVSLERQLSYFYVVPVETGIVLLCCSCKLNKNAGEDSHANLNTLLPLSHAHY